MEIGLILLTVAVLSYPMALNFHTLRAREHAKIGENMYYPLRAFEDEINLLSQGKVLCDGELYHQYKYWSGHRFWTKRGNSCKYMWDIYFNQVLDHQAVEIIFEHDEKKRALDGLEGGEFIYAFMSRSTVKQMQNTHLWESVSKIYDIKTEPRGHIFLLARKPELSAPGEVAGRNRTR